MNKPRCFLTCQLVNKSALSPLMGKVPIKGFLGLVEGKWSFSEHSFTFLFEGKYILFVFSLLIIPEKGSQIIIFFNNCQKSEGVQIIISSYLRRKCKRTDYA